MKNMIIATMIIVAMIIPSLSLTTLYDRADIVIVVTGEDGKVLSGARILVTIPQPPGEARPIIVVNETTDTGTLRVRIDKAKLFKSWREYVSRRGLARGFRIAIMIDAVWVNETKIVASLGNTILVDPLSREYVYRRVVLKPTWVHDRSTPSEYLRASAEISTNSFLEAPVPVLTDYEEWTNVMFPLLSILLDDNSLEKDTTIDEDTLVVDPSVYFIVGSSSGWELAYSVTTGVETEYHIGGLTVQRKFSDVDSKVIWTNDFCETLGIYDPSIRYALTFYVNVTIAYEKWSYFDYWTGRHLYDVEKVYVKDFETNEISWRFNYFVEPEGFDKTLYKTYIGTGEHNDTGDVWDSPNDFTAKDVGSHIFGVSVNEVSVGVPINLILKFLGYVVPFDPSFILTYLTVGVEFYGFWVCLDGAEGTTINVYVYSTGTRWYFDRYGKSFYVPLTSIFIDELGYGGGGGGTGGGGDLITPGF